MILYGNIGLLFIGNFNEYILYTLGIVTIRLVVLLIDNFTSEVHIE